MCDVTLDGSAYQELHVDGGAFAQAFLYPSGLTRLRRARMARGQFVVPAIAYVIRNGRLDPEWATTEAQHARYSRARHQHDDHRERPQRRGSYLQPDAPIGRRHRQSSG
jgi:hypothetical protein